MPLRIGLTSLISATPIMTSHPGKPIMQATSETLGKQKVATKGNNNQIQHQVEDLKLCYNLDERTTKLDEAGLDRPECTA